MSLSVVVSAYNEEKKIEECLKSASFADEIILIDNTSQDKTVEIARKYTSKIFTRPNHIMLNINKNFGFAKVSSDWILSLDADERISVELQKEIKRQMKTSKQTNGYWIPRKNIIFGKWMRSEMWWPDYQLRLFKKGMGKFPQKHVHEYLEVVGKTQKLKGVLIHDHYSSIEQYLYKMEKIYTESEVKNKLEKKVKVQWHDCLRYPISDFLKTFFLQKGYKDGLHGLVLSMLQAFYMEVVFVKLWEKQGFKDDVPENFPKELYKEFGRIKKEFRYWVITSLINETRNPLKKIILKIARKRSRV